MSEPYEEELEEKEEKTQPTRKPRAFLESEQITLSQPKRPRNPNLPKNYYFDNDYVESLLTEYVKSGCTEKLLRDEIMANASELIRQIIRTHKLHTLTNGKEGTAFGDLYQLAWCVTPDTLLFTEDGIEEIDDVIGGDMIGEMSKEVYAKTGLEIADRYVRKPSESILKITTKFYYNVKSSKDHKFLVLNSDGVTEVKAGDLKLGDLLPVQYNQQCFGDHDDINFTPVVKNPKSGWMPPSKWTPEFAYIIGLLISEGSIIERGATICNTDKAVINFLKEKHADLHFGMYDHIRSTNGSSGFVSLLKWLDLGPGTNAGNKTIPKQLMRCSKPIIIAMLRGMFDGDGHSTRHNGTVGYTSSSKKLIDQLRVLLLNFGIVCKTQFDNRTTSVFNGVTRQRKPGYQIMLSTTDAKKFYDDVGFMIEYKIKKAEKLSKKPYYRLPEYIMDVLKRVYDKSGLSTYYLKTQYDVTFRKNHNQITRKNLKKILPAFDHMQQDSDYQYLVDRVNELDNLIWVPIISLDNIESPTVNIRVPKSSTFCANGILTKNCQIESSLYKFDSQPGHTKVFNFWSQVAKTVMLAHIKKESRDKRNYGTYKEHLDSKGTKNNFKLERFIEEAKDICCYDDVHMSILDALQELCEEDDRPYDGLIDKLVKRTGHSRIKVSNFIRTIRLRSFEFSDAPINKEDFQPENKYRVTNSNYDSDDE